MQIIQQFNYNFHLPWTNKISPSQCCELWTKLVLSGIIYISWDESSRSHSALIGLLAFYLSPGPCQYRLPREPPLQRGNTAQACPVLIDISVLDIEVINTVIISNLFRNRNKINKYKISKSKHDYNVIRWSLHWSITALQARFIRLST